MFSAIVRSPLRFAPLADVERAWRTWLDGRPKIDPKHLAEQLSTVGEVSAMGAALDDLAKRHSAGALAGLVLMSDFDQNAGVSAVAAARRLGVKIYTVGVGATAAVDVAVHLDAPLILKKDERSAVTVILRRRGLDPDQQVDVTLSMRKSAASAAGSEGSAEPDGELTLVEQRTVTLDRDEVTVDAVWRRLAVVVVSPARDIAVASQR